MKPQEVAHRLATQEPEVAAFIRAQGAAEEAARIKAVRRQVIPGHEALIERLAFDGITTGPEAAVAVVHAETARALNSMFRPGVAGV